MIMLVLLALTSTPTDVEVVHRFTDEKYYKVVVQDVEVYTSKKHVMYVYEKHVMIYELPIDGSVAVYMLTGGDEGYAPKPSGAVIDMDMTEDKVWQKKIEGIRAARKQKNVQSILEGFDE